MNAGAAAEAIDAYCQGDPVRLRECTIDSDRPRAARVSRRFAWISNRNEIQEAASANKSSTVGTLKVGAMLDRQIEASSANE
jgi:hypothetical protein